MFLRYFVIGALQMSYDDDDDDDISETVQDMDILVTVER